MQKYPSKCQGKKSGWNLTAWEKNAAEFALSERALGNRAYIIIFDSQWQKEIWEMKMKVFIDMQVYLLKYRDGLYPKIHKLFERE